MSRLVAPAGVLVRYYERPDSELHPHQRDALKTPTACWRLREI
jgi:hypothetical protein